MGTYPWEFILVTVALLLDPTFGDVLVQPGYGQPGKSKDSVAQSKPTANQPIVKAQQNYYPQQNPYVQLLQQRHALEHQYLQHQHVQEHNQLLQLQQMELQNPAVTRQYQNGGQDIVGSPLGLLPLSLGGPLAALNGARLFSLGPMGLNGFRMGSGLGGFPLLLSPQQQGQMSGSTQFQKSMDGSTQSRTKRDVRDAGDSSGRKYRPKAVRVQQDGLATNPTLRSKSDSTSQNAQTGKTNDQIVGDANDHNNNNNNGENVGSSLLDPLGLVDKTENLIDGLKSGHLPNPLDSLNRGGLLPGFPNFLNKANSETPQFEEHVVGQSQYKYPTQGSYNMMNQQSQQQPIVGASMHGPYPHHPFGPPPHHPFGPPPPPGLYRPSGPFGPGPGGFGPPYPYRPPMGPQFLFRSVMQPYSMNMQGGGMGYGASPMTGGANPALQNPAMRQSMSGNQQMTGAQNPAMSTPQMMTEKTSGSGQSSSTINSMGNEQIVGAPNPQTAMSNPGGYEQMTGSPNPTNSLYQLAQLVQPMMGTLLDPVTGNALPAGATPYNYQPGGRNTMMNNPMMNNLYDQSGRMNYNGYGGGMERRVPFGMDMDMYDDRYNHMHHHGGFDRIYDALVDEGPFGRPHYVHNHEGFIL